MSKYALSATAGANIGDLRAQTIVNYVPGFDNTPTPGNNQQAFVRSFTVVNLYLNYDLSRTGNKTLTDHLAVSLTINNLFDQDPPHYAGSYNTLYNGYANGATVGRLIQVGVSKKI